MTASLVYFRIKLGGRLQQPISFVLNSNPMEAFGIAPPVVNNLFKFNKLTSYPFSFTVVSV